MNVSMYSICAEFTEFKGIYYAPFPALYTVVERHFWTPHAF